jgi:hypothetical protein
MSSSRLCIGAVAGVAVAVLSVGYAIALCIGLLTLPSPQLQIQDPWFTSMELLILCLAPAMVALAVGLHAWAPTDRKSHAQLSIVFMSMCALVTCCVHFAILTLSRQPIFATGRWPTLVFAFRWPSVVYALEILAWDVFFPLAALFAALAIPGAGLAGLARSVLFASAALAFVGLAGVPLADMNVRNIGIIGYVLLYPIAAVLLSIVFRREARRTAIVARLARTSGGTK